MKNLIEIINQRIEIASQPAGGEAMAKNIFGEDSIIEL